VRVRAVSGSSLAAFQAGFVASLFDPLASSALAAQPAFAVYRNTMMSGCIDALQANFPSVARLVGSDWFRAAAATCVRTDPPHDGRLLMYGERFADFLAGFEPARELPYLPGVARLDRLWIEAHTAADANAVEAAWLAQLSPEQLGATRLAPHPAARWCHVADLPVFSIWSTSRQGIDPPAAFVWQGEGALLTRPAADVQWQPLEASGCVFLDACADGQTLAEAASAALGHAPELDVAALLSQLLSAGALTVGPTPDNGNHP
jgi:hypothetical protein